jgi:hypothetical protein
MADHAAMRGKPLQPGIEPSAGPEKISRRIIRRPVDTSTGLYRPNKIRWRVDQQAGQDV